LFLLKLGLAEVYVSLRCILVEFAVAVLALNTVIRFCLHLRHHRLLFCTHLDGTAATAPAAGSWPHSLSKLHRLQLPLGYFAFFLLGFGFRLLLLFHFLCVRIFLNTFSRRICCLPLLLNVEGLSFLYENFLAYFSVLDDSLGVKFTTAVLTLNQLAYVAVFIGLIIVLIV